MDTFASNCFLLDHQSALNSAWQDNVNAEVGEALQMVLSCNILLKEEALLLDGTECLQGHRSARSYQHSQTLMKHNGSHCRHFEAESCGPATDEGLDLCREGDSRSCRDRLKTAENNKGCTLPRTASKHVHKSAAVWTHRISL